MGSAIINIASGVKTFFSNPGGKTNTTDFDIDIDTESSDKTIGDGTIQIIVVLILIGLLGFGAYSVIQKNNS